jgi:hypothetical protein
VDRQRIGGIASLLMGFAFMWAAGSRIWGQEHELIVTLAIFAAVAFGGVFIATVLFRPRRIWTFPALFSAPMFVFALLFLGDPSGVPMFGGGAVATFVVGTAAVFSGRVALGSQRKSHDAP